MLSLFPTAVLGFVVLQAAPSSPVSSATVASRQIGDARKMTLVLPHELGKGETAWLLVKVGVIDHNQIRLTTQDGRPLGTISPFGVRPGQATGTYTVPVPTEDFHDGRLTLRLSVIDSRGARRVPTSEEVRSVRLVIRRFKKQPLSETNP